jgi:hypothetical protein
MEMGIVVTAFYLFGMVGLVILDAALEEPTEELAAKAEPKVKPAVPKARPHKKAA